MDDAVKIIADTLFSQLSGAIEWHDPGECRDCDQDREEVAHAIKDALQRQGYRIVAMAAT